MAKMIPPHWHDNTPRSEQRVFSLLQNDPQTKDWVVLHSLNLKQSGTRPYGEVDFVALIPGAGVFCLEVKGGRVARKDGAWTTTDATGATFPSSGVLSVRLRRECTRFGNLLRNGLPMPRNSTKCPSGLPSSLPMLKHRRRRLEQNHGKSSITIA